MVVHGSAFEAFGFQTDWRLLAEWWWFRILLFGEFWCLRAAYLVFSLSRLLVNFDQIRYHQIINQFCHSS